MDIAVKGVTWTEILLAIPPGEYKDVPFRYTPTIRNLISASLSVRYPERKFTTKRINDNTLRITAEA